MIIFSSLFQAVLVTIGLIAFIIFLFVMWKRIALVVQLFVYDILILITIVALYIIEFYAFLL